MGQERIVDLPPAIGPLGLTDLLEIVQPGNSSAGVSKQATARQIANTFVGTVPGTIEFLRDGGGVTLATGTVGYLEIPYTGNINTCTLVGDQSGTIVMDLWQTTFALFDAGLTHPTSGDSITGPNQPSILGGATKAQTNITGWTTLVSSGNWLAYNIISCTNIQRVTLSLGVTRTVSS